jgi:competence CoiA-like predicted nuclease
METYYHLLGAICRTTGQYVLPTAATKQSTYECPDCKTTVIFRQGKVRAAHFSHKAANLCTFYDCSNASRKETQIHQSAKYALASYLREHEAIRIVTRECSNLKCYKNKNAQSTK